MNEKEQLWYARFLEYADSGMSQRRWCIENQISASTFIQCNRVHGSDFSGFRFTGTMVS
ncbi:MAG: IS66 family insertion sequence element accessory protein TnpA [Lentihominibacter sp.]